MKLLPAFFFIASAGLILSFLNSAVRTVRAQEDLSFGIAQYYKIIGNNIDNGSIIVATENGYELSSEKYSISIIGVTSNKPAMSLKPKIFDEANTFPVLATGKTEVRVTAKNGAIGLGDLITSSDIPGVGMKADKPGFVIGSALETFSPQNPNEEGKILISLDLHFSMVGLSKGQGSGMDSIATIRSKFMELYNLSAIASYEQPSKVFRYVVSGLVLLISVVFSFFTFARIAKNGIEAIGRNPLASKFIGLGIALNVAIAVTIVISGVGVAYLILAI